ncbi:MAG: glycosyl hydrolase, partial [Ignavibacteriaceae bacterium]
MPEVKPFTPPIKYERASQKADSILKKLTLKEKIELIGGHNYFYIKGYKKHNIPRLYLSDATQGIHIRRDLPDPPEKSTAFPAPICLSSTWNTKL